VSSAEDQRLAEAVRRACLLAAEQAAEDAGISGLCWEGRFEAALDAIRSLRLDDVHAEAESGVQGMHADPRLTRSRE
jgi:hypothetical protein